ncbi:MAG: dockerin type I domain-containing protein [Planctomycetota bacterium]|jgi:hypothetical protein
MKLKALSVLAGLAGALIVCDPAPGALQGFLVVTPPNPFDLLVANVYAQFDNPDDRLLAVAGTAGAPLIVEVLPGTFFQHEFGGDTAPPEDLVEVFPSLAYDTFVTIGRKISAGDDNTALSPAWPGFGPSSLSGDDLAWFALPPDSEQTAPDANLRVLIGQFSGTDWAGVSGRFLVLAISDGELRVFHTGYCVFPLGSTPCTEGDVTFDNIVNVEDFLRMLSVWGPCPPEDFCWEDLNHDGTVNVQDFLMLLALWTPPPVPLPSVDADLDGDGVVGPIDLLTLLSCWGPVVEGCEPPDLDGDGLVGTRDLLVMLVDWG